jgi:inner membrane transporter RhtA
VSRLRAGLLLALVGGLLFGSMATLGGWATEQQDPLRVATIRMTVAGLVLLPVALTRRAAIRPVLTGVAIIGVLQILINGSFYLALPRLGVGPTVGIEFIAPAFIVIWDRVAGHLHPRPVTWVAVSGAVLGVGLLVEAWDLANLDLVGVAWGLAAAVFLAMYLRYGETVGKRSDGLSIASGALVVAGTLGFFISRAWDVPADITSGQIWAIVALGTIGMAIPLSMEISSLERAPARLVGIVITIEPVAAAITAWVFLGEALSGWQVVGVGMIVASIGAISLTTDQPLPEPETIPT